MLGARYIMIFTHERSIYSAGLVIRDPNGEEKKSTYSSEQRRRKRDPNEQRRSLLDARLIYRFNIIVSPAWKESFKRSLRLRVSLMRAWLIKSPTAGGLKSSVASIKCGHSGGRKQCSSCGQ